MVSGIRYNQVGIAGATVLYVTAAGTSQKTAGTSTVGTLANSLLQSDCCLLLSRSQKSGGQNWPMLNLYLYMIRSL